MSTKNILGYFGSWKVYSTCKIEDIDPTLLTILIYAFAGVNNDGTVKVLDHWADIDLGGYKKFTQLKSKNPSLKTLLAIGGWNVGSTVFSDMTSSASTRKVFIESAIGFIREYGFDGIDIDWEYPTRRGGRPEDKQNFSALLKELRQEFDKFGYILTVAVVAGESNIDPSYQVPELSKYVDHINVMTYDMHSASQGDSKTGENAPLFSNDSLNVQHCIKAWLSKGAPPSKVILGVGSYGHSFTLANPSQNGIGDPATGPGLPGPRSKAAGTLGYDEILEKLKNGWTRQWSQEQQVPYAYGGNQWVGYDDVESIKKKVGFAKQYNLGGIMMWSIDTDDPHGLYGPRFPLLHAINSTH